MERSRVLDTSITTSVRLMPSTRLRANSNTYTTLVMELPPWGESKPDTVKLRKERKLPYLMMMILNPMMTLNQMMTSLNRSQVPHR